MKVVAVQDHARACLTLYVELGERPDGTRLYLAVGANGEEVVEVAPCAEAPAYMRLGRALALSVAEALTTGGATDEPVTLETWKDFVELVAECCTP